MGTLDSVVSDVGNQLGMSIGSASSLLSGLLSTITQQEGGLSGFLDRLRRAGVGNTVSSWFKGETKSISPDTVENALGRDTIQNIARHAVDPPSQRRVAGRSIVSGDRSEIGSGKAASGSSARASSASIPVACTDRALGEMILESRDGMGTD